jgi:hypothetical protein
VIDVGYHFYLGFVALIEIDVDFGSDSDVLHHHHHHHYQQQSGQRKQQ